MADFIYNQIAFFFSLVLILFLPGFFLLNLIEVGKKYFSSLEKFIISAGLSIVAVNFLLIIIGRSGIAINKTSVLFSIIFFVLLLQFITHAIKKRRGTFLRSEEG